MQLKTYFSNTIEAAMGAASREIGEEAVLVYSRESSPEARYLGRYEVVFGVSESASTAAVQGKVGEKARDLPQESGSATKDGIQASIDHLARAIATLDARVSQLLNSAPVPAASMPEPSAPEFADEVLSRVRIEPCFAPGQVVVFAGRAGAGKTTALMKIAATLHHLPPSRLVTYDPRRLAAGAELDSFARIIGARHQTVSSVASLLDELRDPVPDRLTLVDTPGYTARNTSTIPELSALSSLCDRIEFVFALSGSAWPADQCLALEEAETLAPARLLLTRLDEARHLGPLLTEAVARALPLSFVSNGMNVPEDLEQATESALRRLW